MSRLLAAALAASVWFPANAVGQSANKRPTARAQPHPLPVIGATREHFEAVDAVTIGDRIFAVERGPAGGWLRVYDASDVANPLELREATAPIVGRPIAVAGDGDRVLVASITQDTSRLRLTLFDVSRSDRTRWSGAASIQADVRIEGVEQMYVSGTLAFIKPGGGSGFALDIAQLERDFSAATRGDEASPGGRASLRALAAPGALPGADALSL